MGFDRIAEALGHQLRRHILVALLDHNPVNQSEVIARNRTGENADVALRLFHMHFPKLDEMGYIVWDRDQGTILKGPNWEEIGPVVRTLRDNADGLPDDTF